MSCCLQICVRTDCHGAEVGHVVFKFVLGLIVVELKWILLSSNLC